MKTFVETVTDVKHYSDKLFYFRTTKSFDTPWLAGMFTMIGMPTGSIMRAYSIVSPPSADYLEFLSIVVPDGPLTSKLVKIGQGHQVKVSINPKGTLVLPNLQIMENESGLPKEQRPKNEWRRLWMISTGTGIAPFMSIARDEITMDPEFDLFDEVIVTHTCRHANELVFKEELEAAGVKVYQTVTGEDRLECVKKGRITNHIKDGSLFSHFGMSRGSFDPRWDRVMVCGNPALNIEMDEILEDLGFVHGTASSPGTWSREKAFFEGIENRKKR